jgi:hypothetical protein
MKKVARTCALIAHCCPTISTARKAVFEPFVEGLYNKAQSMNVSTAFAPSASWDSLCVTDMANLPSPELTVISSDESSI